MLRRMFIVVGLCLSLGALAPGEEPGTWSIAAVDREAGQIGIAGASCTHNVQGIGEVIPGVGAVIVQGMSSDEARSHGLERLRSGETPEQIVAAMGAERFEPSEQQYAVVSMDPSHPPATFSGSETAAWRGAATDDGVSVQGNSLVGRAVVTRTLAAFREATGPLARRLVRALSAGAAAGGDWRCGKQRARSAFVTVYNASDPESTPYFHLVVYGIEKGGQPAVARLAEEFEHLFPRSKDRKTTRTYIIPGESKGGRTSRPAAAPPERTAPATPKAPGASARRLGG